MDHRGGLSTDIPIDGSSYIPPLDLGAVLESSGVDCLEGKELIFNNEGSVVFQHQVRAWMKIA